MDAFPPEVGIDDGTSADLTPGQRALWALWVVDGEVANGGFEQFFFNSSGSLMDESIDSAERVGADHHAQILRQAAALYPNSEVPEDRDERERLLQSFPKSADRTLRALADRWYARDGELEQKMVAYVEGHPDEFFR